MNFQAKDRVIISGQESDGFLDGFEVSDIDLPLL